MPSHTESSPLLPPPGPPIFTPTRVPYLDNLRTVLVALLILHHAALTSTSFTPSGSTPHPVEGTIERRILGVFTTTNEAFLWSTFYLISGYSSSLVHAKASGNANANGNGNTNGNADGNGTSANANAPRNGHTNPTTNANPNAHLTFLKHRSLPHTTHALAWSTIGRTALAQVLTSTSAGQAIFGTRAQLEAHLSGPASYLALLVLLDCVHVSVRALGPGSRNPRVSVSWVRGWGGSVAVLLLVGIVLLAWTYLAVTQGQGSIAPLPSLPNVLVSALDHPLPDGPLSCIIAYTLGANWLAIKASLPTIPLSQLLFPFSLAASYVFLTLASVLSSSIAHYIQPVAHRTHVLPHAGPNPHTLVFVLWDTLTSLILPPTLLWCFATTSPLCRPWPVHATGNGKTGYALTYVHMVPVLVVRWLFERLREEVGVPVSTVVSAVVVGAGALGAAWAVVRGVEVGVMGVWKFLRR